MPRPLLIAGWLIFAPLLRGVSAQAPVNPLSDAQAAYDAGDFPKAASLFRPAAEQGNPIAQYSLGLLYENGQGVPQDNRLAGEWYRKAADQGHPDAQNNLASFHISGLGVPVNVEVGVNWLRKAAQQGHAGAQYNLGIMYTLGQGIPKNFPQAETWLRLAADQGATEAKYNLGVMYEQGDLGTPQPVEAYKWYILAAKDGFAPAVEKKTKLGSSMTPEQIAQAVKSSTELKPMAPQDQAAVTAAPQNAEPHAAAAPLAATAKGSKMTWPILVVLVLLAAGVAAWKFFKRFKPLKEDELNLGLNNTIECERITRYYIDAGRSRDFVAQNPNKSPEFYGVYGRSFLKACRFAEALALLELNATPGANDAKMINALKNAVAGQSGDSQPSAAWPWNARFRLALELSTSGLHTEAVSLIDDEIRSEAAKDLAYAECLAAIYKAAGIEIQTTSSTPG